VPELKTVFAGSPEFAARILARLIESPFQPAAVFTQPDRPTGRGRKVRPNAVKRLAETAGIELFQPKSLRDKAAQNLLENLQPDVFIVAAYGLILPQAVLDIPRFGCLNVHASLLPRWRGAAPIERAVMAGDKETGVCIMEMQAGLDTGPVFAQTEIPIAADATALALTEELADAGGELLIDVLTTFAAAKAEKRKLPTPKAQDDNLATYANKLEAADRMIDWSESAQSIVDKVRALAGRMPVRCLLGEVYVQILQAHTLEQHLPDAEATPAGTLIDVSKRGIIVQCENDLLQITRLKVERGKGSELDPAAAINGYSDLFFPGARFAN
jgi:methionyl-tRNA formyltransferase